jgi:Glycosyl transferase family 2/Methyltransferase domain
MIRTAPSTSPTTTATPDVSVVVPTTLQRPRLLQRAIGSVRRQAGPTVEIIVVADVVAGTPVPDLGTDVTVVKVPAVGLSAARNAGMAVATARWIALLDDDDVWADGKLARQVREAERHGPDVIVSSKFWRVVNGAPYDVLPRVAYPPGQDLSEYIFCRRFPSGSSGLVQPSTVLAGADLMRRCGFTGGLQFIEDIDWVLRATKLFGARFVQIDEPLVEWHVDDTRSHLSGSTPWRYIRGWVEENPQLFTRSSAAGAVLRTTSRTLDARQDYPELVKAAFANGRPRGVDLLASAVACILPTGQRRSFARLWGRLSSIPGPTVSRAERTPTAARMERRGRAMWHLYSVAVPRFRRRRMQLLREVLPLAPQTRVLDVGGTPLNWQWCDPPPDVTITNLSSGDIVADGRRLPFREESFDVVFSNSVVEHVGGPDDQRAFAREVARVGRTYFVQTPNRYFPLEPHFLTPLFQFVPRSIQRRIARFATVWGLVERPPQSAVDAVVQRLRLLTPAEMGRIFPDGRLHRERVLGLTKSLIAVRTGRS